MKPQLIRSIFLLMLISHALAGSNTSNIYEPWEKFADRITTCLKDQFILPEPNYFDLSNTEKKDLRISHELQEYTIHGWENGQCVVSNKDHMAPGSVTIESQYCNIPKEDLKTVANFAREVAENGQSKAYVHKYVELLKKHCTLVY